MIRTALLFVGLGAVTVGFIVGVPLIAIALKVRA